jgi:hypothetical protein
MTAITIPRRPQGDIDADIRRYPGGDHDGRTPTAPFDKITLINGVTIWSRWAQHKELQCMADAVTGDARLASLVSEIFCDSKAGWMFDIHVRNRHHAREAAERFARTLHGYNGVMVLFDETVVFDLAAWWNDPQ